MQGLAAYVRSLDPRLKMLVALALGPSLWLISPVPVIVFAGLLLPLVLSLSASQPLGSKMIRSLFTFIIFWVGIKCVLDGLSGFPIDQIVVNGGVLGLRLVALLLLGLALALSTSARSLGLAVSWCLRPCVGNERAWKIALSLALMVHFLPICLSTMNQVKETLSRRCPEMGFSRRMTIIPHAVIRNLGQKTWSQTLAVAGRGLERADAWKADFSWSSQDTVCALFASCLGIGVYFF